MVSVELMVSLATIGSLFGALIVSRGHILWANCLWACCDIVFIMYALIINDTQLLILFSSYMIIAFYGIIRVLWNQRKERLTENFIKDDV